MFRKVQLYFYVKKRIPVVLILKDQMKFYGVIEEIIKQNEEEQLLFFDLNFLQQYTVRFEEVALVYEMYKDGEISMTNSERLEKQKAEMKKIEEKELALRNKKKEVRAKISVIEKEIEAEKFAEKIELTKNLTLEVEKAFGEVSEESVRLAIELLQSKEDGSVPNIS